MKNTKIKPVLIQLIYAGCVLLDLVLCLTLLTIFDNNDTVCIITVIFMFVSLFVLVALMLIEDRKSKKVSCVTSYYDEYLNKFKQSLRDFNYSTASDTQKLDYLVYSMYCASRLTSCVEFYCSCHNYSKEEMKEMFSKLQLTEDFKTFIDEIIINKKLTKSIYRFEAELYSLLLCSAEIREEVDPLLFDDKVLYDPTKHLRYRVIHNEIDNNYIIEKAELDFDSKWQTSSPNSLYGDFELAHKECERLLKIDLKGKEFDSFFEVYDYSQENENWNNLIHHYDSVNTEPKYRLLCNYYCLVGSDGHEAFFDNNPIEDYIENLQEFLPKELHECLINIKNAINKYDKLYYFEQADKLFYANDKKLETILQEYANNFFSNTNEDNKK